MLFPTWLRRVLIAVAAILMCSCRADGQSVCESCPTESPFYVEAPCESGCQPLTGIQGPRDEYLCDGDDSQSPAAVLHSGKMAGLDQEDTVGHYRTKEGHLVVTPSNRVCIYAPRFGAVRQVINPMGATKRVFIDSVGDSRSLFETARNAPTNVALHQQTLVDQTADTPAGLFRTRMQAGETVRLEAVADTIGLVGPYSNLLLVHLGQIIETESAIVSKSTLNAITWTGDQQVQVTLAGQGASAIFSSKQPGVIYEAIEPNNPRLRVCKLASTDSAHPGDEVEFTLRFDNVGDTAISEVTILDNLTARLAYVEGTAQSTLDADFSTERNTQGSLILKWQITEPISPGKGGVLTFKTRVR